MASGQIRACGIEKHKDFIFPLKENRKPLKENRKVALSQQDKQQGRYVCVSSLLLEEKTVVEIWLEGVDLPLLLPNSCLDYFAADKAVKRACCEREMRHVENHSLNYWQVGYNTDDAPTRQ